MIRYTVVATEPATQMAEGITDARERRLIYERMVSLEHDPQLQGKRLRDDLAGFRSVRAVGQRYRIIYRVEEDVVTVVVVALGRRKAKNKTDVYALAQKLVKAGIIRPPDKG